MAYPQRTTQTLFDAVTPTAIVSSTNATPTVITANSHGLTAGQRVMVYGHTTNTAANGIYLVKAATTNTITLGDEITNADVAGNGAGGATGIVMLAPPVMMVADFNILDFFVGVPASSTTTLAAAISLGKPASSLSSGPRYSYPNIGATQAAGNPWSFAQIIDLSNGNILAGSTGIVVSSASLFNQYEVNIDLASYFTVFPISWTAGAITVKAMASTISS